MKSSNLVSMDERLNSLRFALGCDWGQLAEKLSISRAMLGFVRRGDKPASPKLMYRIVSLETEASSQKVAISSDDNADWRARALDAERKLKSLRGAIKSFNEVVAGLEGAL